MFEELLKKIGIALDRNAIPYMIIGGQENPNRDEACIRHWLKDFSGALGEPFDQRFEDLLESID